MKKSKENRIYVKYHAPKLILWTDHVQSRSFDNIIPLFSVKDFGTKKTEIPSELFSIWMHILMRCIDAAVAQCHGQLRSNTQLPNWNGFVGMGVMMFR